MGIGLALAPVESIRRRVAAIAAEDLSQRVPTTGGDDEIARMANTLNEMLDRLESSSKFQQEFVSNASHELRSPLTTLLATVERATSDQSNADWNEVAETIMREGRRLDVIVDGLFWLARHDENQLESERIDVDLDDLLFEESQRVRAMSGLNVDTTGVAPTRVSGDPAMLKRMIRNVVDNAMRYATSELRFASFFAGSYGVVTVADDGEGIDVAGERAALRAIRALGSGAQSHLRRHGARPFYRDRDRDATRRLGPVCARRAGHDDRASHTRRGSREAGLAPFARALP
jgi:signal transduction histidine kinase